MIFIYRSERGKGIQHKDKHMPRHKAGNNKVRQGAQKF